MNAHLTFLASLLLLANAASAADCNDADGKLPRDMQVVYEFTQAKTISTISRPLSSSGVLGVATSGELLWQTTQPLKSTMVIDAEGMKVFNRDDKLVNELSDPAIRNIAALFQHVLKGDAAALGNSFRASMTCANNGKWQLDLKPETEDLRKLLRSVTVTGAANVDTISFTEIRGDATQITLVPADIARLRELESYLGD